MVYSTWLIVSTDDRKKNRKKKQKSDKQTGILVFKQFQINHNNWLFHFETTIKITTMATPIITMKTIKAAKKK